MRRLGLSFVFCLWAMAAHAQLAGGLQFPGPGTPHTSASGMVTPLLFTTLGGTLSTTAVSYANPVAGSTVNDWTSINTIREAPVGASGTFSNLVVNFPTVLSAATSYTIALTKNGAATALQCTISSISTLCTDTVDTVSVSNSTPDIIGWEVCPGPITGGTCVPGTAPASQTLVQISAIFTSSVSGESIVFAGMGGNNLSSSGNFIGLGYSNAQSATEANVASVMPTAGVISNLGFQAQTAPGAAASVILTVQKNGSPTALTCTVSGASQKLCSDQVNSVSYAAGDTISLGSAIGSGAPSNPNASRWGIKFTPTIAGESVIFNASGGAPSTSATRFRNASGAGGDQSTETNTFAIVPIASTFKKLFVNEGAITPGGATTRTITLRKGTGTQSSTAVTCTIASAATTCNDTSNTSSASLNDFVNLQTSVSGTPAAVTVFSLGMVVTVP